MHIEGAKAVAAPNIGSKKSVSKYWSSPKADGKKSVSALKDSISVDPCGPTLKQHMLNA